MDKLLITLVLFLFGLEMNSQVFINEIMARNNETIADEAGEFDDWIEIYNPTSEDVDLAGGYFTDDFSDLTLFQVPTTNSTLTTVPAGGYLIFWADGTPEQGENHLGLQLSAGGEQVALVLPNGEIIIDSFQFVDQENDISYGRTSDGASSFQYFTIPTPNATNQEIIPNPESLFINEIQAENTSTIFDETGIYEPWIEIYNPNSFQVNLAGQSLDYNNGESVYTFENTNPNESVVEANSFKLIWCDGQSVEGLLHTNFSLANSGNIKLISQDLTVIDDRDYSSPGNDLSVGSDTDGSDTYITFSTPTPDVTNELVIVIPEELYINELMANNLSDTLDNFGEADDWLEIYNPNSYEVNLAGYHLSDNLGGGSWEIPDTYPDSVTVPAMGFLLFWADNDEEQGVRHTNFKLTGSGEDIVLLSPDDFTVADYHNFPVQSDDVSWGREEDGSEPWVYFTPEATTPEYSNDGSNSVQENSNLSIKAYPNPVSNSLFFNKPVNQLKLLTADGKLVMELSNISEVDLTDLKQGVYLLVLNDFSSQRIVVE